MDVKTLCLGLLSLGDRSGYEIKKTLEENFRHFFRASFGSIYPALAELERAGHVVGRAIPQAGRPPKKVYGITPTGHTVLGRTLAGEEPRHIVRSEFLVLMYFAHLLPPDRLAHVIDDMIGQFENGLWADLEQYERTAPEMTPGQRFALGYGRAVVTTALAYLKRHRAELLRDAGGGAPETPVVADAGLAAAGD